MEFARRVRIRFPVVLAFLNAFAVHGQIVENRTPVLNESSMESAIGRIAGLIRDHYVFEESGGQIAAQLMEQFKAGRFREVKTWSEFADASTRTLRHASNDGHLYVRHDPAAVRKQLATSAEAPDPAAGDPFYYGQDARHNNFGFKEVKVLDGNIGYLRLSKINISDASLPTLFGAMDFLANTRALILDVRDNGGGGSDVGPVIESFFLPRNTPLLEFKDRSGTTRTSKTVSWLLRKRYDQPLYILVNQTTASAAEALAFALQAKGRARIVGQPTAGAAYMNSWYVVNDDVFVSVSTAAPVLPGSDVSWEGRGVQPDLVVADRDALEWIVEEIRR